MREGNVGEDWNGNNSNDNGSGRDNSDRANKSTPKKSQCNEIVLLRPTQKKVRETKLEEEETKKKKRQNLNEHTVAQQ